MVAAIAARRGDKATGNITAKVEVLAVQVTGLTSLNDATSPFAEILYYCTAEKSGADTLRSVNFQPSSDGKFTWDNVILPSAGSWTLHVRKVSDDSSVASQSYTAA